VWWLVGCGGGSVAVQGGEDTRGWFGGEAGWHRLVVEHTRELIALLDCDGRYVRVSPSHEAVLGYPGGELVGRRALELVHPDDRHRVRRALAHGGEAFRARVCRRDGAWVEIEGSGAAIRDDGGRPLR
jgi:PAS domain S-box-containing protein